MDDAGASIAQAPRPRHRLGYLARVLSAHRAAG